ncbi:hypothetical protein KUCAC02_001125, partial [Chaenocephalus aceratus]
RAEVEVTVHQPAAVPRSTRTHNPKEAMKERLVVPDEDNSGLETAAPGCAKSRLTGSQSPCLPLCVPAYFAHTRVVLGNSKSSVTALKASVRG